MASVRKRFPNDPASPWVVAYTDQGGKRRLKTFKKKRDADRYRTQVEAEIERGEHVAASESATISVLCKAFVENMEGVHADGGIGRQWLENVRRTIRLHIEPKLGGVLLTDLSVKHIDDWYAYISAKPKSAYNSRKGYLAVLKAVEDFAFARGYTKRTPVGTFKRNRRSKNEIQRIQTFDVDAVKIVLAAVEERAIGLRRRSHEVLKCAVNLAAFLGLRKGEILGLRVENVDIENRIIRVRNSLTYYQEVKGPKTKAGIRDVPIPPHVAELLDSWKRDHYLENDERLFFTTRTGKPIDPSCDFHHSWRRLLIRAGLAESKTGKSLHFHALRHFAASWMIASGMPPSDVAELLGHRTFDMTLQVYAHPVLAGAHRKMAVDRMAHSLIAATANAAVGATKTRHITINH